ncbi:MAG TPA: PAS domain-containing protein [Cellulomonas sp.]|uniref:PAS domain-containing protein n=1 Tax=Cellulomonas sp. TaxID=40001 RepID=UPI002E357251|nr:PAS domain-containing protein [Cellulomonas sp.]HEX5333422.1 PAS domain-containing protein [Cellulomonas sp.]
MTYPAATNPDRVVGVDELFFSTTDRKGIIASANSVFVALSHYSRSELLGAPHNIIRHPDMPAGAFTIMWDRLLSGRPMVAYVKNLAKDGSAYWVFATITPLGDGFLSVRGAICRPDLWEIVKGVYEKVLAIENAAREQGHGRPAAARIGAAVIAEQLAGLGFPGYGDFLRYLLPAEVSARATLSQLSAERPDVPGGLGALLGATHTLDVELSSLLVLLDGYLDLAASLSAASKDAMTTLAGLSASTGSASRASAIVADRAPVLTRTASAMSSVSDELGAKIRALALRLEDVHGWVMELRFRIALARLHNDMATSFAVEVAEGRASPEGISYVPLLCRALEEGTEAVTASLTGTSGALREVAEQVIAAEKQLNDFQYLLANWRLLVTRAGKSTELGGHVGPIDVQQREGREQMGAMRDLAARCLAEARPYDPARLRTPVSLLSQASAELSGTGSSAV